MKMWFFACVKNKEGGIDNYISLDVITLGGKYEFYRS